LDVVIIDAMTEQPPPSGEDAARPLPYPYNLDLSGVLRNLNRVTPQARYRLANDVVTKSYLFAAMQLLEKELGPDPVRRLVDPEDEESVGRPLLSFLSQRRVVEEVAHNPAGFVRRANLGSLRSTWRTTSDFVADVLRFGLWAQHYLGAYAADIAEGAEQLVKGPNFLDALQSVAYFDQLTMSNLPAFRLQLVATTSAEGDETIRDALTENYEKIVDMWKEVHAAVLERRGLQLRPDVSADDFADLLTAAVEGLAVRALADRNARVIDHDRQRALFEKACQALLAGCTERRDEATGKSLRETVADMIRGSSSGEDDDED
jgi:hypothetical protein